MHGLAISTVDGMRAILQRVGAGPGGVDVDRTVVWHNMREEPVVYINGDPYVLRYVRSLSQDALSHTASLLLHRELGHAGFGR